MRLAITDLVMPRVSRPLRILLFAGTRPEAIKQAPLVLAARGADDIETILVHSGQHGTLFHDGLEPFGLSADRVLAVERTHGAPGDAVDRLQGALAPLLTELTPDMVVVQGDTSSAMAGAIAAHGLGIPVAHVEAGLRSGDPTLPHPEEGNRIAIARLTDLHLAPSDRAARNLHAEGVAGYIHVVGNTGIDALLHTRRQVVPRISAPGRREIVVTAHRREVLGAPLDRIAEALKRIVSSRFDRHVTVLLHANGAGSQLRTLLHGMRDISCRPACVIPRW